MIYDTTKAELRGETEVIFRRDFRHPPERVFEGLTRTDLLRKWLPGPPGWELTVCEMPEGPGPYRWRWRHPEQGEFGFHGDITVWDRPGALHFGQNYDPGTLGVGMAAFVMVEQSLEAISGGTRMEVLMRYDSAADREAAMATGMAEGMEMSYAMLESAL